MKLMLAATVLFWLRKGGIRGVKRGYFNDFHHRLIETCVVSNIYQDVYAQLCSYLIS